MTPTQNVDCLSDFERRELDLWIAEHIEQFTVTDNIRGNVAERSMCRLTDAAWKEFKRLHPHFVPKCSGPYPIAYYSFNPVTAINCFQDTEYAEGWTFTRLAGYWHGMKDGLMVPAAKSLALSMMMALRHEYEYQNKKEKSDVKIQ